MTAVLCTNWHCLIRYWWAKIRGLASVGDFEELERFSKQKKSPIGYEVCNTNLVVCTLHVHVCIIMIKWISATNFEIQFVYFFSIFIATLNLRIIILYALNAIFTLGKLTGENWRKKIDALAENDFEPIAYRLTMLAVISPSSQMHVCSIIRKH